MTLAERNVRVSADITHIPDCDRRAGALETENANRVTVHLSLPQQRRALAVRAGTAPLSVLAPGHTERRSDTHTASGALGLTADRRSTTSPERKQAIDT
jgi:hypothetical protein